MKIKIRFVIVLLFVVLLFGCAGMQTVHKWEPYIGCSEEELYTNWGLGGDSTYYRNEYDSIHYTWYSYFILLPYPLSGYSSEIGYSNICIGIQDGKIVSVLYR